jgi:hypothetical protein
LVKNWSKLKVICLLLLVKFSIQWGFAKMVIGFTMIKVLRGQEDEAYLSLKNVNGVNEVHRILGEYSLFVIMQAENNIKFHRLINTIKAISGVLAIWNVLVSHRDIPCNVEVDYESKRTRESNNPMAEIQITLSNHV